MNKLIEIATDNRYKCTCCGEKILKGKKYFRDAMQSYNKSHTVNICYRCIARLFLKSDICGEELDKIKNEIMIERIEGD